MHALHLDLEYAQLHDGFPPQRHVSVYKSNRHMSTVVMEVAQSGDFQGDVMIMKLCKMCH